MLLIFYWNCFTGNKKTMKVNSYRFKFSISRFSREAPAGSRNRFNVFYQFEKSEGDLRLPDPIPDYAGICKQCSGKGFHNLGCPIYVDILARQFCSLERQTLVNKYRVGERKTGLEDCLTALKFFEELQENNPCHFTNCAVRHWRLIHERVKVLGNLP